MHKYQIILFGIIFLWTMVILDQRKFLCKKTVLCASISVMVGLLLVTTGVLANCYLAFVNGFTHLRYDPKIVLDTLLLTAAKGNEHIYLWQTVTNGQSFIVAGLEIFIICRFFRETQAGKRVQNIIVGLLALILVVLLIMLFKSIFGYR